MTETIVCLEQTHLDPEIIATFRLLKKHGARQTDIDGFAWGWTIDGELPRTTINALTRIDALMTIRKRPLKP